MSPETLPLALSPTLFLSLAAGVLLGLFYFAALWMQVRLLAAKGSKGWFWLLGFGLRASALLLAFWWLARAGASFAIAAFLGFLLARTLAVYRARHGKPR